MAERRPELVSHLGPFEPFSNVRVAIGLYVYDNAPFNKHHDLTVAATFRATAPARSRVASSYVISVSNCAWREYL